MVVGELDPATVQFSRKWKIMCADEDRVVGIMVGGMAANGHDYLQTYCQIMTITEGLINGAARVFGHSSGRTVKGTITPFVKGLSKPARPSHFEVSGGAPRLEGYPPLRHRVFRHHVKKISFTSGRWH
jgi:hypothetical protein